MAFTTRAMNTDLPLPFYVISGTLRQDAPSYIERQADNDLYAALRRGEFCYVLTARQMGKSSLMSRTAARLRAAGVNVAALDLTAIGQNLTAERWYAGLLVQVGDRLGLGDELIEFWLAQPWLSPLQRWVKALRTVVLPRCPGPLVISIDEIDAVLSLPFPTDEFFAGIRECYNLRSTDPEMQRLTFCLLGVATPADLIRDTRTTPFNIGHRIVLHDFTAQEAAPLAFGFRRQERQDKALLQRVLHWTGGHPYLTQRLCQAVAEDGRMCRAADVDRLCDKLFFAPRAQEGDDNMLFVRERLLRGDADVGGLLALYDKVRRSRTVRDDGTDPKVSVLRLSGVTRVQTGRLAVRNRIYARVFNKAWVVANMPDAEVRRQRAAFRRGVWRTALVSAVVLTLVGWLAFVASQQAATNRRLLYFAQMKLAQQEWENANTARVEELLTPYATPTAADLRGFEWHLLWRLTHNEVFRLNEGYPVASVTLLPDGETLAIGATRRAKATGSDEYLIKLYDFRKARQAQTYHVAAGKNFDVVVFSSDKQLVAVDGPEKETLLFNLRTGQMVAELKGHQTAITAAAFSADGRQLAAGSVDGVVRLWEVATGAERLVIKRHQDWIRCVTFSPTGNLLATTDESQAVRLWEVASGRERPPLIISEGALVRAWFFPDGTKLVTAVKDGRLLIWDIRTRRIVASLAGHAGEVTAAAFSPEGKLLATGSANRTVKLWEAATGRELATIRGHGSAVKSVTWSADGQQLVTGSLDGTIKVWSVSAALEPFLPVEPVVRYLATTFVNGRELLALGVTRNRQIKLWNLSTGQELASFAEPGGNVLCAAFSPDNKWLATGGLDQRVRLWETATGQLVHTLVGHTAYVLSVAFAPDGSQLVSGSEDQQLHLWEVARGRHLGSFVGGAENYYRAVFSPNGRWLASACRDGSVKLWDVTTRTIIKTFVGHTDRVRAIAFSQDNRLLATGGKDNTVRLWEVTSGQELKSLGRSDAIQRATFSADGRRLVTGGMDGTVKLWDVTTQQELITLNGHLDAVTSVTFSAENLDLVTSGADGTVRLWRTRPLVAAADAPKVAMRQ
jgi:WD40 repeat protein